MMRQTPRPLWRRRPRCVIDGLVRDGVDELAARRSAARARPSPPEETAIAVAEALQALADVYAAIEEEEIDSAYDLGCLEQ